MKRVVCTGSLAVGINWKQKPDCLIHVCRARNHQYHIVITISCI